LLSTLETKQLVVHDGNLLSSSAGSGINLLRKQTATAMGPGKSIFLVQTLARCGVDDAESHNSADFQARFVT
jgi:hypothetical protein